MRPYGFTTLLVVLFITIFNSYSKTANKYYLEKVSSVPFSQKRFIIDTLRNGSFIYTLTGTEGSNVVNLYRLGLNNNSIDFLNINVKPANWMFDSEGNWSAVAFTFHPNDSSLYIVSFAQNNFAIQKFGHSSLTFNNVTTLESPVIDQNHTFANSLQYPNIKLGWISSNLEYYLLLALHPHKIPQNDNPFFSLAAFYDNCTWHELLPNPQIINKMVFSFEFECHKCNTITFRLISTDQISYLQYDQGSLAFNEINIVTAPENRKVRGYPVLAKDIDGSTFILYQFSDSQVNEIVIQRISNTDQLGDPKRYLSLAPIYSIRPDGAIQVSGDDVYVALVSQTELLQVYNGSEWADGLRGMSDIVLMRMSRSDLSMKDSLIMSSIGDDNSSRIDIESDGRIILTGITQGNLADPSTGPTVPAGRLFFANIRPLAIKGVTTPLISTVPGEILIQPGVPILVEFDSLPSQAFTSQPVVQFGSIPVAQVQWNATKLSIIPPCDLPLGPTDLFVNFSALPYSPIATKSNFNVIKPTIVSVKPDAVDTNSTANLTLVVRGAYYDQLFSSNLKVGDSPCTSISLVDSNTFSNGQNETTINCTLNPAVPGVKKVSLSLCGYDSTPDDWTFTFIPTAYNHTHRMKENTQELINLNCTAFGTQPDELLIYLSAAPSETIGNMSSFDDTQVYSGTSVLINDSKKGIIFRPAKDVHGSFEFQYYCYHKTGQTQSKPGFIKVDVFPTIDCQADILISEDILLDRRDVAKHKVVLEFITLPAVGKLVSPMDNSRALLSGEEYRQNVVKYKANYNVGDKPTGTFSYIARNQFNLSSDPCEVKFNISCAPLHLNVFNRSSESACHPCPFGATCSFTGQHLPYAAPGFWKSAESDTSVFLPCSPKTACPGSPSGVCAEGYSGTRCAECSKRYYKLNDNCISCGGDTTNTIIMIVVVAVGGIVLLYLLIRLTANGPGLGIASISINFVQMIVIVRELQLNWTTEFQAVMNSLSFVNLNIELVSPECLIQDESINYTFKMKVTLLLPVIFIGILAIIAIMNSSLMRKARSAIGATSSFYLRYQYKRPDKLTEWRAQTELYYLLLRGFHALLIFLYVTVTSKTLSFFDCTLEGDSFYYLDADRSLRCYEPWWYDNLPFALAGLLFYVVGIPVYFLAVFFFLYQERRDGAFWMKWKDIVKEAVSRNSFFKDEYQYFIFIQLMQKLFMISVKQFFTRYTTLQILLTIFLCLFAYATYWRYKPYNHMTLNYLEILSVVSSGLILGFGLLLYNQEFPSEKNRFVISILLLLLIFGFFCAVAVAVILEFHSRLKDIPLVNRFFFPPLSPASSVPELNSKPLARAKSVKVLEPARSTNGLNRESKRSYSHLPAPQGNLLDPSHMFIRSTSNLSGDNI